MDANNLYLINASTKSFVNFEWFGLPDKTVRPESGSTIKPINIIILQNSGKVILLIYFSNYGV